MGKADRHRQKEHGNDGMAPLYQVHPVQPQKVRAEVAEALAVKDPEHDGVAGRDHQDLPRVAQVSAFVAPDQRQGKEQQHKAVPDVPEDHPEKERESDGQKRRRIDGRVARQGQEPGEELEGAEKGRVAQGHRHLVQVLLQDLLPDHDNFAREPLFRLLFQS